MIIHNIFPTPVAKFTLGRDFTSEELAFVNTQPQHKNEGNTTSDNSYVLRDAAMNDLKSFIDASVNEYLKTIYAPKYDVSLRVTQSWLNYTQPGQWHHRHVHPNSFVSGVLYIKAVSERDKIYFYKEGYQQIKIPSNDFNLHNSESWWFDVGAGDLIIFPSSLPHMVARVEEERVSLSFNTFPTGHIGEESVLSGLHLS